MSDNKRLVLVIDDDPLIREILVVYLETHTFKVISAQDGRQAETFLKNGERPALAFVDMLMPDQEGIETIAHVKKMVPDIKIIAMSGGGIMKADDLLRFAEKLGADASIVKPIDFEELDHKIKMIL